MLMKLLSVVGAGVFVGGALVELLRTKKGSQLKRDDPPKAEESTAVEKGDHEGDSKSP